MAYLGVDVPSSSDFDPTTLPMPPTLVIGEIVQALRRAPPAMIYKSIHCAHIPGKQDTYPLWIISDWVLAALRHLEEVHNRRFVRVSQASDVRRTSDANANGPQPSAGSEEPEKHVFNVSSDWASRDRTGDRQNLRHLRKQLLILRIGLFSDARPLPLVGTEAKENDEVTLHVFGGGVAETGDENHDPLNQSPVSESFPVSLGPVFRPLLFRGTEIHRPKTTDPNASTHDKAWELVGAYAEDSMKRPVVEEALQALLGDQFHPASIWAMTLNQLTECDSTEEVDAVMTKAKADFEAGLQSPPPSRPAQAPRTKQLAIAETELMATIADLHQRKRISASGMPTLQDLVDLEDERDVGNAQFKVQTDAEIVAAVRSKKRLPEAM
ncbi:hypothetical protein B0H14DRAFT_2621492 [Mycena olivaceomarginata]|nr:hypothetical protein B0H14DRAFT_2621492 [Mycena olivaceomarginata]